MIGRAVYADPFLMSDVDRLFYGVEDAPHVSRRQLAHAITGYIERALENGVPAMSLVRHLAHWRRGGRGARNWRRWLHTEAPRLPPRRLIRELLLRLEAPSII